MQLFDIGFKIYNSKNYLMDFDLNFGETIFVTY